MGDDADVGDSIGTVIDDVISTVIDDTTTGISFELFDGLPDSTAIVVARGISESDTNLTVQQFMSTYCQGNIKEVMLGQFLDMSTSDVQ